MKANELFKDKNKLLMGIPVILGLLFIYVFFIHAGQPEETQQKEDASAFLNPPPRSRRRPATSWKRISGTSWRSRNRNASGRNRM